ncbi:phage/plasmid primase, P4 family [Micrococcus antarcticus]|uniref:DNA primase family protein n=1 Tax=Micrococcus antarcticus TaxID=86171 RepID=UPI00384CED48
MNAPFKSTKGSSQSKVKPVIAATVNELIAQATAEYLDGLDPQNPPDAATVERELLAATNLAFGLENVSRDKTDQIPKLRSLTFTQVAEVMVRLRRVVLVVGDKATDIDTAPLGIYMAAGPDAGTYVTDETRLRRIARSYNRELTINMAKEVFTVLRELAPVVRPNADRDLIAVNNGIFDYRTKTLHEFSPDHVFMSKIAVNYNAEAENPHIQTPDGDVWDVETWMAGLSDDEGVPELLWQVTGAIVRPHVSWKKSAWYHSDRGNNGKGTLVTLQRNLCGEGRFASIPLSELGKDFMLEQLLRVTAILTDENDVGTFIDKAANLKAIITNDVIMINRKHKMPISYQFWGFMVQCLNESPRFKDKSGSFYRRQLFIPFKKWFGEVGPDGRPIERKYIKDDYLGRKDVLEYVLWRVLAGMDDYYALSEPAAVTEALDEFKRHNDPVRDFWAEHREQFVWDLLPFNFLYDMFKSWTVRTNPSGSPSGRNTFIRDLRAAVETDAVWDGTAATPAHSKGRMLGTEPLIAAYELKDWYAPTYTMPKSGPPDLDRLCRPHTAATYRGLVRTSPRPVAVRDAAALATDHDTAASPDCEGCATGDRGRCSPFCPGVHEALAAERGRRTEVAVTS